jgi:Na+-translocating ferredoxin:NAD+ oxidoreductase subunit G
MPQSWGVLMLVALALTTAPVVGQTVSRDEVLASAYPGAAFKSEQVFLTSAQQARVAELSGTERPSAFVVRYVASKDGTVVGRAYVDTHVVRTKKQSLLVMLDGGGRIKRVEATAFLEPGEYRAPGAWMRQYNDRVLTPDLAVNRAIRPIAGATLTGRAVNGAVRRVLAIDQVVQAAGAGSHK